MGSTPRVPGNHPTGGSTSARKSSPFTLPLTTTRGVGKPKVELGPDSCAAARLLPPGSLLHKSMDDALLEEADMRRGAPAPVLLKLPRGSVCEAVDEGPLKPNIIRRWSIGSQPLTMLAHDVHPAVGERRPVAGGVRSGGAHQRHMHMEAWAGEGKIVKAMYTDKMPKDLRNSNP